MANLKITDRMPQFKRSMVQRLDEAIGELANDIHRKASMRYAPFKDGRLRGDSHARKMATLNWRVEFNVEYALAQEQGYAGSKIFRQYTTAGTGKRFLRRAGDEESKKAVLLLKKHGSRARA